MSNLDKRKERILKVLNRQSNYPALKLKRMLHYMSNMQKSEGEVRKWNEKHAWKLVRQIEDELNIVPKTSSSSGNGKTALNKRKEGWQPSHVRKARKAEESRALRIKMRGGNR